MEDPGGVRGHRLTNASEVTLTIYIEPWGGEYSLDPGEEAVLRVTAADDHPLEWKFLDEALVISSLTQSPTAYVSLWKGGQEVPAR